MTEKFDMTGLLIPDGILHDQKLSSISLHRDKFVLGFDIEFDPNNYYDDSRCEKYKDFKKCEIVFHLKEDGMHEVSLKTAPRANGTYIGYLMTLRKFTEAMDETLQNPDVKNPEYVESSASNYAFTVELSIHPSTHVKFRKYDTCDISIAADSVEFIWE